MTRLQAILFGSAVVALAGCAQQPQKQQQAQATTPSRVQAQFMAEPQVVNGVPMVPTGEFVIVAPDPSATGYNDPLVQRRQARAVVSQIGKQPESSGQ